MSDGFMIVGEENVKKARILTLRSMLKLEVKGLKVSRGRTAYAIIKEEFGFTGNKQKVLEQLSAYINEHILPDNKHCPECGEEINPASMMGRGCSEAKRKALTKNAKQPRPNRKKGVKK